MSRNLFFAGALAMCAADGLAQSAWDSWPPREYLLRSLVNGVERVLESQDPDNGQFGTKPWICNDQNVLLPLAAAWSIEDDANPWFHDERLLTAIAKGGEALVDAQDEQGKWTFRKKDNSTWGQVHQPWTFSRWIRAYALVREALPEASRQRWEEGLTLGFSNIRRSAAGQVGNMTAHNMMALYIAGVCFDNEDWREAAAGYLRRTVEEQEEGGYWSEHRGPVIGYNRVYVELLGIHYHFSGDPVVLDALRRAALFHASVLLPDGSDIPGIDERQLYHQGVNVGNVGFTFTPEGRGYLLQQLGRYSDDGERLVSADYAANMLLYGESGTGVTPPAVADESTTILTTVSAATKRIAPWQWTFSTYPCRAPNRRWVQDRQNLIDIYHDAVGLITGGGHTKLQPYWSTFTVGDPSQLKHTPGDTDPDFTPDVDLLWTPDMASINVEPKALRMALKYGGLDAQRGHGPYRVRAEAVNGGALDVTFSAPANMQAEAHLPLLYRGRRLQLANGDLVRLSDEPLELTHEQTGDYVVYDEVMVTVPAGARLLWPAKAHNPYKRDGSSPLTQAKLVLAMPFDGVTRYTVRLSHHPEPPFEGLVFEARELPVTHSEGTYTKRLDMLGSQFMGTTEIGSTLSFRIDQVPAARYELFAEFVMASEYGIVQVLVDGAAVGEPFDAYCEGVDSEGERVRVGTVTLTEGAHDLAVKVVGRNPASTSQTISVKRWLLKPLD